DVWSPTNSSTNCNNAVFKIRIIENLAEANFNPVPVGCVPYEVSFVNNSLGTTYHWDFGDGTTSSHVNPTHTYTEGGTYTVTLIANDPTSCNLSDTIQRTVSVVSPNPTILDELSVCQGESIIIGPNTNYPDGTTFEWIQGSGLSNSQIQNPSVNPATTNTYIMVAHSVCNDTVQQTVNVIVPNVSVTTSNDTMICPGGTATIHAFPSGNASSVEWAYDFNFGNIFSTESSVSVSPISNSTYYVRVRENECNTYANSQVNVSIHQFNYSLTPSHIICPNDQIRLTVSNNSSDILSYQWQPTTGIINGQNTGSPIVSPSVPTTYHVTITNQMGCTTTNQVQVNIDNITSSITNIENNVCYGYCSGSAQALANGIPPYTYSWSNGQSESVATNLCVGSFTVTVTDANSCTSTSSVQISQPPALVLSFSNIQEPICDGIGYGSATVNVSGGTPGYTYLWSFNGSTSPTNNECLIGTNTVTITDHNGCVDTLSITMPAPGSLTSQVNATQNISCFGFCDGSIHVSASQGNPPYQYNWSNGAQGNFLSAICSGSYTVTITDADLCVSHQVCTLTQPDLLTPTISELYPIPCFGDETRISATITGGTSPYTFIWSTNQTNESPIIAYAGTYSIQVTDSHDCTSYADINISQPDSISISHSIINQLCSNICNGQIDTYTQGGTQPYTYNWTNNETTSSIGNLCSGEYSLTVTDANNCQHIQTYSVENQNYIPRLSADASSRTIYFGESVRLIANTDSQGSFYWDNKRLLNDNLIFNPIATPKENTIFMVEFRDSNNCIATDTVFVKVLEVICRDPYIFVPNAFSPNNDGQNDFFKPFYPFNLVTELYFAVFDR
ncbi:MAG: PKD domain-containing protein, partial [Bacteroidales bacterium]|nr:PKD domain-containing protein [Bacteroidales bacterium]